MVNWPITSSTYNIYLLLLDMSKAFDTVCRSKLLTDLQEILEPDEMHMMAVLISDVVLTVKVGKELGDQIKTEVGIAQGDCPSAVLFIFYLAKSMTPNRECIEHNYASVEQCGNILPEECQDHDYYRKTEIKNYFEIDPKYADDISWATTAKQRITYIKETTPSTLAKRNLMINESKTEDYEIIRQGNEKWKNCKLLGSLLDTEKDINRRKILAIDAFKTLNQIFDSRKISNTVKSELSMHMLRVFSSTNANCGPSQKNWKTQSTLSKGDNSEKS